MLRPATANSATATIKSLMSGAPILVNSRGRTVVIQNMIEVGPQARGMAGDWPASAMPLENAAQRKAQDRDGPSWRDTASPPAEPSGTNAKWIAEVCG